MVKTQSFWMGIVLMVAMFGPSVAIIAEMCYRRIDAYGPLGYGILAMAAAAGCLWFSYAADEVRR